MRKFASPSSSSLSEQFLKDDIPLAVQVKQNAKSKAKAMGKAALATEPTTTKGGTTKKVSFKGALKKTVARKSKTTLCPIKIFYCERADHKVQQR